MSEMLHEVLRDVAQAMHNRTSTNKTHDKLLEAADMLEPIETLLKGGAVHWEDSKYYLEMHGDSLDTMEKETGAIAVHLYDGSDIIGDYINLKPYTPKPVYKDGWYWTLEFESPIRFENGGWQTGCSIGVTPVNNPATGEPWKIEEPKYVERPDDDQE